MNTTVTYINNEDGEVIWSFDGHTGPIPNKNNKVKGMTKDSTGRMVESTFITSDEVEFLYTMQGNLIITIICYRDYSNIAYGSLY